MREFAGRKEENMFAVIFVVHPKAEQWDAYLGYAKLLSPELEKVEGFIDNVRYGSKRGKGDVLSLSTWRDEKALVRWRTIAMHHEVQEKGRFEVFLGYHLRVGQVTADTHVPEGQSLHEQRLDETEVGAAKVVSIIEMMRPADLSEDASADVIAARLGLVASAQGLLLLLVSWQDTACADAAEHNRVPPAARHRRVRVVRDYGMFDRREAPQYYPEVKRNIEKDSSDV
jgi:heme-degrading monooxygenase HmoA